MKYSYIKRSQLIFVIEILFSLLEAATNFTYPSIWTNFAVILGDEWDRAMTLNDLNIAKIAGSARS